MGVPTHADDRVASGWSPFYVGGDSPAGWVGVGGESLGPLLARGLPRSSEAFPLESAADAGDAYVVFDGDLGSGETSLKPADERGSAERGFYAATSDARSL